jgi:hypothetical protein
LHEIGQGHGSGNGGALYREGLEEGEIVELSAARGKGKMKNKENVKPVLGMRDSIWAC